MMRVGVQILCNAFALHLGLTVNNALDTGQSLTGDLKELNCTNLLKNVVSNIIELFFKKGSAIYVWSLSTNSQTIFLYSMKMLIAPVAISNPVDGRRFISFVILETSGACQIKFKKLKPYGALSDST